MPRPGPSPFVPAALVVAAAVAGAGRAAEAADDPYLPTRAALAAARDQLVEAAAAIGRGDPPASVPLLEATAAQLGQLASGRGALPRAVRLAVRRTESARASAAALTSSDDPTGAVTRIRRAAAALRTAVARLGSRGIDGCALVERGRVGTVARAGRVVRYQVLADADVDLSAATLVVENDDPGRTSVETEAVALGRGRFRVRFGPDLGPATLTASCGAQPALRVFCTGGPGALSALPPGVPDYGAGPLFARVGTPLDEPSPWLAGDPPFAFDVAPPLPDGLALDPATGAVSGTPTVASPASTHRITVRNARASAAADLEIDVDPALPAEVADLAGGFAIDVVADGLALPVKMAFAPDGRLFFSELGAGALRVIGADGALAPDPVATVPLLAGAEQGIFGVAVAADFAETGHVYVVASAAAEDGHPLRNRLLRFTVAGATATGPDVLVDDLPLGDTQNGGHLLLGQDGRLYLTTGDVGDAPRAQADGDLAGRVLRIATDGSVPADNPDPASYEWCRGFRNPFGLTQDPLSGRIFATENGPAANDELDLVQPGKNFEWGADPDEHFGALTGIRIRDWTPVIVPTGLAAHDGTAFGASYAGDLFVGCYDPAHVRRIELDGVDLVSESVLVQFTDEGLDQKPLDVVLAPDGSLRVSTFRTIWRVRRD